MIYTLTTDVPIAQIQMEMDSKAKEFGFGVLHQYAFREILQEKGYPIEKEITVFELCNPEGAQRALTEIPEISVFLPCRISLYELEEKVMLSTIGFESLLSAIETDQALEHFMNTLYTKLKGLMQSWNV